MASGEDHAQNVCIVDMLLHRGQQPLSNCACVKLLLEGDHWQRVHHLAGSNMLRVYRVDMINQCIS